MKKFPHLYYGWVIVGVLAMANAITMVMGTVNLGLFAKPMGDGIGISRAMFGWAQTARSTTGAFTSPYVGKALDKFGARILLPLSVLVAGVMIISLAFINSGLQMILLFAAMGILGIAGPTQLITSVPVTKWFVRLRGRALGISSLGAPIGAMTLVPISGFLIVHYGWRETWIIIGITAMVVVCPVALLLLRRQPEDMGLKPDGDTDGKEMTAKGRTKAQPGMQEENWTLKEARKSSTYWRLLIVFSIITLGQSTLGLHKQANFIDRGLSPQLVANAVILEASAAAVSTIVMGFLYERIPARIMGAIAIVLVAFSAFFAVIGSTAPALFASGICNGVGFGGTVLLQNQLWPSYYGRKFLGAIRGSAMLPMLMFSSIGPPAAGYVFDATGSYRLIWWVGISLMLLGAVVLLTTAKPLKKSAQVPVLTQV